MEITQPKNKQNKLYIKVYGLWKNMMDRCYKESHPRYFQYGGMGYYVENRWHSFDNFVEDVDKIQGFNLESFLNGELTLDKDHLKHGNKIYSLSTCCFISRKENNKIKPSQQKNIIGISPEGKEYIFYNQSQFACEHNLRQGSISDCITGRLKTHRGWKFTLI